MHTNQTEYPLLECTDKRLCVRFAKNGNFPHLILTENHQRVNQIIRADRFLQKGTDSGLAAFSHKTRILHGTDHNDLGLIIDFMDTTAAFYTIRIRKIHIHRHDSWP